MDGIGNCKLVVISLKLKQHASRLMLIFMKILEMYLKINYCEEYKNNNLHIAIGNYNPRKIPKSGHYMQIQPLLR
jgi:hypothetical protein